MNIQKARKAFTLTELLVWIAIISIVTLWVTSINFNRLSSKQNLEILTNKIKSNYEFIRNNALSWKWINSNLIVPEKWKMEISLNNSWTIVNSYLTWWLWNPIEHDIVFMRNSSINKIRCLSLDKTFDNSIINWTWEIIYEWWNLTLSWWCDNPSSKILEITVENNNIDSKIIEFNIVNWLVEIKNN